MSHKLQSHEQFIDDEDYEEEYDDEDEQVGFGDEMEETAVIVSSIKENKVADAKDDFQYLVPQPPEKKNVN